MSASKNLWIDRAMCYYTYMGCQHLWHIEENVHVFFEPIRDVVGAWEALEWFVVVVVVVVGFCYCVPIQL